MQVAIPQSILETIKHNHDLPYSRRALFVEFSCCWNANCHFLIFKCVHRMVGCIETRQLISSYGLFCRRRRSCGDGLADLGCAKIAVVRAEKRC